MKKNTLAFSAYHKKEKNNYSYLLPSSEFEDSSTVKELELLNNGLEKNGLQISFHEKSKALKWGGSLSYSNIAKGLPGNLKEQFKNLKSKKTVWYGQSYIKKNFSLAHVPTTLKADFAAALYKNTLSDPLFERDGLKNLDKNSQNSWHGTLTPQLFWNEALYSQLLFNYESDSFKSDDFEKNRMFFSFGKSLHIKAFSGQISLVPSFSVQTQENISAVYYGLGLSLKTFQPIVPFFHMGRSGRFPTLAELYLNQGEIAGNEDLQAETSLGGDVGIETSLAGLNFKVSYFLYEQKNLIQYLMVSGLHYKPFNFGKVLSEGFEISSQWNPIYWLTWHASITGQNVLNRQKGQFYNTRVPGHPRFFGHTQMLFSPNDFIDFGPDFLFAEKRFSNRANTVKIADRFIVGAKSSIHFKSHTNLSLQVKNIFNRTNYDLRGHPLEGRSYYATLQQNF